MGTQCQMSTVTTQKPCPAQYQARPETDLLCQLWVELDTLQEEDQDQDMDPILPSVISPPPRPSGSPTVFCIYSDRGDDAASLCELWCQIQEYSGLQCAQCPDAYRFDPESKLLCHLWEELEKLKKTNTQIVSPANLQPVECIHEENPTSSLALCELWCEIQGYTGSYCIQCPEIYKQDPANSTLCELYTELQIKI